MKINIFVQARMSSTRFPGKVLAPINQKPLIKTLLDNLSTVDLKNELIVLTSRELSDDPLVFYLERLKHKVFRGDLDNVFFRFYEALQYYPCDFFVRICADSPFIDPQLVQYMVQLTIVGKYDLLSNVFLRKFPKGQSVEILKSSVFMKAQCQNLSEEEKEHVIPYFYKNKDQYKCLFLGSSRDFSDVNQCVDTVEDIKRIENNNYIFSKSDIC